MKTKKIVISVVALIILVAIFLIVNIYEFSKKLDSKTTTTTMTTTETTTKKNEDKIYEDTIIIEGLEEKIYVHKYISHLGYEFKYEDTYFNPTLLSNGSVKLEVKDDEKSYLLIEKLSDTEYYQQYEELNDKEIVDDYNYLQKYTFIRANTLTFIKITKTIKNDIEDIEGLDARMDYIINSLSFN